ncbi:MAG: acylneuraminate cytidylyltransferase family protein [Rhodocyclaceae bacterium]|nr:acylneuraminate cytidylyltransferase family protein [Rhodocyclaceae bacterium]MCA3145953.1 acylneuraminate cytidylyltransferase family protein [Rhodocyclaceae bacterium]
MKTVAFIFARGGSKGLPGKNVLPFCGKPMIAWSIAHAKAVERIERVIVSTDDEAIATVAREHGAETPFLRPAELARDDSPEWLAWRHALIYLHENGGLPDAMVSVPVTAPLREPTDIERCLDVFETGDADVVVTVSEAHRSPYFNMVRQNEDGTVDLVIAPAAKVVRRQDVPAVFDMATVAYVAAPHFVLTREVMFDGRVRAVSVPAERAIDIDTLLDFQIAECLMKRRRHEHD